MNTSLPADMSKSVKNRMARQRITTSELGKLLNSADQPIYVLDEEFVVVFLNRACRRWLEASADGLLGVRCLYHTDPETTGREAAAARLCPPPGVLLGKEITATVSAISDDGESKRRTARFLPLGIDSEDTVGTLVVMAADDLDEDGEEPSPREAEETPDELHDRISRFRSATAGRHGADQLVGKSAAIELARRQVELAAVSDVSVLMVGPPGSGRARMAGAIHYGGNSRLSGGLVPIGCSLLDEELIYSTVNAIAGGGGSETSPAGGSLLLSDADSIPPQIQADLAAALSAKSFPMRVLATAETPLIELAKSGKYSEKLAEVLSTLAIQLPSLTDRREDIPALAQLFLEEANARGLRQLGGFSAEALDLLDAHPWKGNIDELSGMVAEAHGKAEGSLVEVEDLPQTIHMAAEAAAHPPRVEEKIVLDEFLARVEKELIIRAMKTAKGNKAHAARLLGMTRPRLYRRLLQLGMLEEE